MSILKYGAYRIYCPPIDTCLTLQSSNFAFGALYIAIFYSSGLLNARCCYFSGCKFLSNEPAQWRHRHGEQNYGHGGGGVGREEEAGEMYGDLLILCNIDSQWGFAV